MTFRRAGRPWGRVALAGALLFLGLLFVPARPPQRAPEGESTPFRWDAADLFEALEAEFQTARVTPLEAARAAATTLGAEAESRLERISSSRATPAEELAALAEVQFRFAVLAAAHPELLADAQGLVDRSRVEVVKAAAAWPANRATHEALYRVLFGGRIAIEEALVQAGPVLPELVTIEEISSVTPSLEVQGVRVHSGDLILSRGGAPTSALIARGNDFANTFSHAGLVHIDPETGVGTVVESLIETGTILTTVEEFLGARKHGVLVLRLRPDLPALVENPMLPHEAATAMLSRLSAEHANYDFAMDWEDTERMFCSEVIYHAYQPFGVDLWSNRSAMTTPGLVRWLGVMGVEHFRTLVPSDLEYDARLRAVAAWRNIEALTDYRLDNAITDVLLEAADQGVDLGYSPFMLPVVRVLKGASVALAAVGGTPLVPTGMSADAALRVRSLVEQVNPTLKAALIERAADFEAERGYPPPYWSLVELAREVLAEEREGLAPSLISS